jgi:ABC-type lipoprotein export system ATPase subunit
MRDASKTVPRGEIVALLGPSVSGKSTFLTAVGMINLPTTSQVRIGGRDSATGTLRPPGTLYRHLLNTPKL